MKGANVLILFMLIQFAGFGSIVFSQNSPAAVSLEFCALINKPNAYDGKNVMVRATYRYGFEWQEIYCLECRGLARTWLEFLDLPKDSERILKKFPKDNGTVTATFTGIFQSSQGPFGDGGYRFRILVKEISQAEVVAKSGADPNSLSDSLRRRVCGRVEVSPSICSSGEKPRH